MKKTVLFAVCFLLTFGCIAQSYPPKAGLAGSTAIHKNDASFVAWATGVQISRGYKKISDQSLGYASSGLPEYAVGQPTGSIVSLGDRGVAIVTFNLPIIDGEGFDFAVFENGNTGYLELALVKVSSDGEHYFDFPTHSQTQTSTQIGTFGTPQAAYLNNIAGKYDGIYGTPFDLSEIPDNTLLDKNNITHVKIIDVVGSIDPQFATYDSHGNAINDSFPTPFDSGGFDLQAVGVIHQQTLSLNDFDKTSFLMYPNPATNVVFFDVEEEIAVITYDLSGRVVKNLPKGNCKEMIISDFNPGIYLFEVLIDDRKIVKKILVK